MAKQNKPGGYVLSRQWFDFAFENPEHTTPMQGILYLWLIEANNRAGFVLNFAFSTEDAIIATGCRNRKTVWKALNELNKFGFVTFIYKSSHRHQPSILSIINNRVKSKGCLDRSLQNYSDFTNPNNGQVSGLVNGSVDGQVSGLVNGHSFKPQTSNQIVVEYAQALSFFLESKLKKQYSEKYKMAPGGIEKKFEEFYNVKFDIGELNNKSEKDILSFFSNWLPISLLKDNEFSQKNNFKNGSANNKSNAQSIIDNAADFLREKYGDS